MPVDWSKYPPNWKAIARSVKDAANWECQECGRPCRKPGGHGLILCAASILTSMQNGTTKHMKSLPTVRQKKSRNDLR